MTPRAQPSAPKPTQSTLSGPRRRFAHKGKPFFPPGVAARPHGGCRRGRRKLEQVEKAIGQLRRERGRLTVRAVAQRADVSVTFLYENTDARKLVNNAVAAGRTRQIRVAQAEHEQIEASWRERALNAEDELGRTQKEVFTQRQQIGELMEKLRDFDQMVPGESVQALTSENITLASKFRDGPPTESVARFRVVG